VSGFPGEPPDCVAHGFEGHAEFLRELAVSLARCVPFPGGKDNLRTELRPLNILPTLSDHVGGVRGGSAQEQVAWVHASWVVAMVADKEARREFAMGQHPSDSVRSLSTPVQFEPAVAVGFAAKPGPATAVDLADLGPESRCDVSHMSVYHPTPGGP